MSPEVSLTGKCPAITGGMQAGRRMRRSNMGLQCGPSRIKIGTIVGIYETRDVHTGIAFVWSNSLAIILSKTFKLRLTVMGLLMSF